MMFETTNEDAVDWLEPISNSLYGDSNKEQVTGK
jgi:hypothetical protein